jgi:DNA (cytosine-5)-methyltransferase 1
VHVGRRLAKQSTDDLPPLVARRPFPDWRPSDWQVDAYLRDASTPEEARLAALRPEKIAAIDMWQDFIDRIPGPIPRFPIWTDVFLGSLSTNPGHPDWKNSIIEKNAAFYIRNRLAIEEWLEANSVVDVVPSYRKFEWQAQNHVRSLWKHAIQFRPSGVRVRPLTYLPALVAINQTSIIGPWRRAITKGEAAWLQGFSPDLLDGKHFVPSAADATAFQQFGNAVHVGVTRFVARALLLGADPDQLAPPGWREMIAASATADRSPAALELDDAAPD